MSKYLNVFNTLAEYQAFSASTEYVQPNVALVKETNVLYYDYGDNKPQANYTDYKVSSRSLVSDGGDTYGLGEKLCLNYIPSGLTSMKGAFNGWSSLQEVTCEIPNSVTNMDNTFRSCTSLANSPKIPNSVTNMNSTFSYCSSLVTAPEIPNSVTSMNSTFSYCSSLVSVQNIPSGVTSLYYTFNYCSSLVNAPEIPSSVTDMTATFNNCTSLVNAPVIPSVVANMSFTFIHCSSIKELTIMSTTPPTYNSTLTDCPIETIYVPDEAVDAYKTASGWSEFADKFKPLSSKSTE